MKSSGTIKILAEKASDHRKRAEGLMFRKYLGKNSGMLFEFEHEDFYPFWMKNTYIPLDIAFINKLGTVVDIKQMYPLSSKKVISSKPCLYALEMNLDWFSKNGINSNSDLFFKEVTSQKKPQILVIDDFKTAVDKACEKHYNIIISYSFKPVEYRNKRPIRRDNDKPIYNDYHLVFDGSVRLNSGKLFEYNDSGNGEYITAPCLGKTGEPRCFFIDGIIDYRYYSKETGKTFIDIRENEPAGRKQVGFRPFKKENPALEGIDSIHF